MNLADKIEIVHGDLTEIAGDAIVNAANNDLLLGGGVAGAIRSKGGSSIQKECDAIGSIPVGGAAITGGGNLKAKFVIHAASMSLGRSTTAQALRGATAHSLRIAAERKLKTIAFPAVGTGIAGFPMRECAEIMLREVVNHFEKPTSLKKVSFVLFDEQAASVFREVWQETLRERSKDNAGAQSTPFGSDPSRNPQGKQRSAEKPAMKTRILFLCTGNRARSQMAEGLARLLAAEEVEVASAGTKPNPKGVHPVALEMLRERGAAIAGLRPKHVDELRGEFDYVITLCDSAAQECPTFPARKGRLHWGQPDPDAAGDDPAKVRRMFEEIRANIEALLREWLGKQGLLRT